MADNLNITSGSGLTISTDDAGGAHYQRIKLVDGTLDSTNPTGVVTNPLIVSVSNSNSTTSVLNTISTISVLNTGGSVSVLNTISTVSVLNTGGSVSVLNTFQPTTISVLNTGGVIEVLNTFQATTISVLNTFQATTISVLNTGGAVNVLNTINTVSVLNTGGTISVLNTGASINILNTRISVSLESINYTTVWSYTTADNSAEKTVWDPTTNAKFVMTDIVVNAITAGTITVRDGTAGATIMIVDLADKGGWVSNFSTPFTSSDTSTPLTIQSNIAGVTSFYVAVSGYEQ